MARKSRKAINLPTQDVGMKENTALYLRLSRSDVDSGSQSLSNQQSIIETYLLKHPELQIYDVYTDNGRSGRNTDRPALQRLVSDIENGLVSCVAVKDLSRLGRNAIDTNYYMTIFFPTYNVRFISVTDGYDSESSQLDILLPLKLMFHEEYAKEIGEKIKKQKQLAMEKGDFIGNYAPYGYQKQKNNPHKLEIDKDVAPIILDIFQRFIDGNSLVLIAQTLNQDKVPSPLTYRNKLLNKDSSKSYYWTTVKIYKILTSEIYIGHMVQGQRTSSYRGGKTKPEHQWQVVKNTHEPLVDISLFLEVQKILNNRVRKSTTEPRKINHYLFSKKLICGCCNRLMIANIRQRKSVKYAIYRCQSNVSLYKNACISPSCITEEEVITHLKSTIEEYKDLIPLKNPPAKIVDFQDEMRILQQSLKEKQSYYKNLYQDYVDGIISLLEYQLYKSSYEQEISEIEDELNLLIEYSESPLSEEEEQLKAIHLAIHHEKTITEDFVSKYVEKIIIVENKIHDVTFNFPNPKEGKLNG